MSNSLGRYVLGGEVITPCGMNLDISTRDITDRLCYNFVSDNVIQ